MCGENETQTTSARPAPRFIPTCVGKTSYSVAPLGDWPVHPHVCGENCSPSKFRNSPAPVHPHVCGENRLDAKDSEIEERFIPTCVGKTWGVPFSLVTNNGSSPRVWGKRRIYWQLGGNPDGSSPRVWGKRCPSGRVAFRLRFIPTCVGKTMCSSSRRVMWSVHPHVCGENGQMRKSCRLSAVHPHVCGENGGGRDCWIARSRFIPTCVGKTLRILRFSTSATGSSPRVWGKPREPRNRTVEPTVHPHVCGENAALAVTWLR